MTTNLVNPTACPRASANVAMFALVVTALSASCAEPFASTCRVADETFVVLETALPLGQTGRSSPLLREKEDGSFEASWLSSTTVSYRNQPVVVVSRAEFVQVPADGRNARRQVYLAPSALRARRGSTTPLGALALQGGVLFPWIEEEIATQADGARASNGRLRSQLVGFDGSESVALSPPSLQCEDCVIQASFAAVGGRAAILATMAFRDGSKRLESVVYDESGTVVRTEELSFGRTPAQPSEGGTTSSVIGMTSLGPTYTLEVVDGGYAILGFGSARLYDASLRPKLSAALSIPPDARVSRSSTDWLFGWPESVDLGVSLRDDSSVGRGEGRGLFFERRDLRTGTRTSAPARFSVGAVVLGVAERGALLRTSDGVDYFARLSPEGIKQGDDIALPQVPGPNLVHLSVDRTRANAFVDFRASEGVVFRRSIVCEP